jgi:aminoglycoside phosphotransferase
MTAQPVPLASGRLTGGEWEHVVTRSYGTSVHRVRCAGTTYYVKTTSIVDRDDLRFHPQNEAERLLWLAGWGLPVPEVVEVGQVAGRSWLVTTAMPGVPATGPAGGPGWERVLRAVADLAATLHSIPARECPFDRRLAVTVPRCRAAVELGTVDLDDLDEHHSGWTGEQLLAELDSTPTPPEDEVVVCHGDLGLDNLLVDPDTLTVTGVIDCGRLGRADRWLDLAIVLRDIAECRPDGVDVFGRTYGLPTIDEEKRRYYRLLDEFI